MIVQFVLQSKYSPFLISPTNSGVIIIIIIVVFVFWLSAPIPSLVYIYLLRVLPVASPGDYFINQRSEKQKQTIGMVTLVNYNISSGNNSPIRWLAWTIVCHVLRHLFRRWPPFCFLLIQISGMWFEATSYLIPKPAAAAEVVVNMKNQKTGMRVLNSHLRLVECVSLFRVSFQAIIFIALIRDVNWKISRLSIGSSDQIKWY